MDNKINKYSFGSIKVSNAGFDSIKEAIEEAILNKQKLSITYANAYTIIQSNNNNPLVDSINNSNIVFPDGTGICIAGKLLFGSKIFHRFNWTDSAYEFLNYCEKNNWTLFFIGATREILDKAVVNLKYKFPELLIVGKLNGYQDLLKEDLIDLINESTPDILWVGLGTPKQELWIENNKQKLNACVIQACGDLFSYFAGNKFRGPKIFRKLGFEWFFRLIRQPQKYFKRYIYGIPAFFLFLLKELLTRNNRR